MVGLTTHIVCRVLQVEQKLGIHKKSAVAHVFIPGYTELASCFLRLALTTELALKRTYNIGYGPPRQDCSCDKGLRSC